MTERILVNRRRFLAGSAGAMGAAYFGRLPLEAMAQEQAPADQEWDAGLVRHILPTVNDTRVLLKVSFDRPLADAPILRFENTTIAGRMSDTAGEYWQFHAGQLQPGRRYTLSLQDSSGQSLCEPWPLSTFPSPTSDPERVRVLFYTCAGGTGGTYEGIGQREGFLPDAGRPAGLPWSSAGDRGDVSESFGTLRFGRLAEILLYDVRRTMNLAGPNAQFVGPQVERWLIDRTRSSEARHRVHVPSNPFGWSAGKWGEWYPDILDPESGTLTTAIEKPYWQEGWLRQHDRLAKAMGQQDGRIPLLVSGDLHAIGAGRIRRSGAVDLRGNPMTAVLSGPISTSTQGFPSVIRGIGATPPAHVDMEETMAPVEDHGFTLIDFLRDRIVLRQFAWDVDREPLDAIDRLEPLHTTELAPAA